MNSAILLSNKTFFRHVCVARAFLLVFKTHVESHQLHQNFRYVEAVRAEDREEASAGYGPMASVRCQCAIDVHVLQFMWRRLKECGGEIDR